MLKCYHLAFGSTNGDTINFEAFDDGLLCMRRGHNQILSVDGYFTNFIRIFKLTLK